MCVSLLRKILTIVSLSVSLATSCSLEYFSPESENSSAPEFVFYEADFTRIKDNKRTVTITGEKIEQYSDGGVTFVQYPSFELYDTNQLISVEGSCDLVSADTDKDIYAFYGNVALISHEHKAKITAENLRWIGEDEIFSSAKNEPVSIAIENSDQNTNSKSTLFIEGSDFTASGFDFTYKFEGPVRGHIIEEN